MKPQFLFILSFLFLMTMSSCQSKEERVISKMESLAERIEKNAETYDTEDWEAVLQEYQQLQTEAADCDFSSEQLRELGHVEGKLAATMTRESAKSFGRSIGDALQNSGQVIQGVLEGLSESIQSEE